ncbi:hypothetical protein TNCV_2529121 [Trichonephila clavipes]|nr:hypothetical protein TNCV_2529121 [Trichonephila clavipes]
MAICGSRWQVEECGYSSWFKTPIMADKDILEFVKSSKNIIEADSDDEKEMKNKSFVPTSSEMRNVMKKLQKEVKKKILDPDITNNPDLTNSLGPNVFSLNRGYS